MTERKKLQNLIKKYLSGQCTSEEAAIIEKWYAGYLDQQGPLFEVFDRESTKDAVWQEVSRKKGGKMHRLRRWLPVAVAASLVMSLLAMYQFLLKPTFMSYENAASQSSEVAILPGTNSATLTTTDGKRIDLTPFEPGILEHGDGFEIKKEGEGMLVFDVSADKLSSTVYNTVETPKGGVYQVILPDGSKVWLNNESSITFPTQFGATERMVTMTGEVYFEVVHDAKRPFKVMAPEQAIEVLGTKFNINAYPNEPSSKTTLIEGSVRIKGGSSIEVLKPGYAMITAKGGGDQVTVDNLRVVLAWKDGVFQFERVKLDVLIRQIARWYDVELVYVGNLPEDEFVGDIKRSEDIRKVLGILQDGGLDIRLEGRQLIVGSKKK
ncbi:FecR family protein [Sphingobacterium hotanense]|uniref:FecR family protein n=1 Tax=Sphingobacterium hotanense TaxID=649196 RepID=UPI0021A8ECC7|nr:FecR domain-containing protein [Sphingobacterium hotanense]MCT1524501.1 FecR domain-containing protein [Sphingobacterium hotanense]